MKFLLAGLHEEVNSFSPGKTTAKSYFSAYGDHEIRFAQTYPRQNVGPDIVTAAYRVLTQAGAEVVPGGILSAQSGPVIEQSVVDDFIAKLSDIIRENLPFDGVMLFLHGAAQSEGSEDPEGDIIEAVRRLVGEQTVIAAGCDLHACVTEKMVKNANVICGYQRYPHVDIYETGERAATLALRLVKKEIKPYMAYVKIPMILPASSYTTETEPLYGLMTWAKQLVADGRLLDFSLFQMQPWLDVSVGGSSAVVIAEDRKTAAAVAEEMAARMYAMRGAFHSELTDVDEIIDIAEKEKTDKPVILNDFADSPGAGAAGDSAQVLAHILAKKSDVRALMYIRDPALALRCREVGVGNPIRDQVGGWLSTLTPPVAFEGTVKSLFDGRMSYEKGAYQNLGPSAVIAVRNTILIVTTNLHRCGHPHLYRSFGYDPLNYDMVVVKACTSFRAFYAPVTDRIYPAATKGPASADLLSFPFKHIPKTFYPFTKDNGFVPQVDAWGKQNF